MVTFVATSFEEEFDPYVFIGSMLCQKNRNWKAIIYNNGPNPWMKQILEEIQQPRVRYNHWLKTVIESFNDSRLIYLESELNTGGWGCYNRNDAINNLVDTEYVVQTSIQDYWLPNAVDDILAQSGNDFIYWDSINHLSGYQNILHAMPVMRYIDWGNFAIKTSIAKQIGINSPEAFNADWFFVRDCIAEGLIVKSKKLNQILTIHN